MKDIIALCIELDECNRKIERIKTDDEYIKARAAEIFKDLPARDHAKELAAIVDALNNFN